MILSSHQQSFSDSMSLAQLVRLIPSQIQKTGLFCGVGYRVQFLHSDNTIRSASANSVELRRIRPQMFIDDLL